MLIIDITLALKALSDNTRLKIVKLLLNNDYCVGSLAKELKISKSATSQHLKILREACLVKGEKRGYYTYYFVIKDTLIDLSVEILALSKVA